MKYFVVKSEKDKEKPFIGEFKFLNVRVWPIIFGSNCKLFAIVGDGAGYKLEDKDFGIVSLRDIERIRQLYRWFK